MHPYTINEAGISTVFWQQSGCGGCGVCGFPESVTFCFVWPQSSLSRCLSPFQTDNFNVWIMVRAPNKDKQNRTSTVRALCSHCEPGYIQRLPYFPVRTISLNFSTIFRCVYAQTGEPVPIFTSKNLSQCLNVLFWPLDLTDLLWNNLISCKVLLQLSF